MSAEPIAPPFTISEPGIYDIPADVYHADPVPGGSMSSTTAKHILGPGGPARVKWESRNPVFKDAYDRGTVVHGLILGNHPEFVVVDATSWQTKAAKEARIEARARGAVALLKDDMVKAKAMAYAVTSHPRASQLLAEGTGTPERSVFWEDHDHNIWRRAMFDWFPADDAPGQPVAVDVKTTSAALDMRTIAATIYKYRYHQQDPFYRDGLAAQCAMTDAAFVFVFVETAPPHNVLCVDLDDDFVERGWRDNQKAMALWAACKRAESAGDPNAWPGPPPIIHTASPPRYAAYDEQD